MSANIGSVKLVEIESEMKNAYIDYAMSVIVGRALPDVRDGLKPVHRRVLFAMLELGLQPNRPYRKCAKIVGEVLGKYHPHGDTAVYDTAVRMAQDFSLRYPLVDGQGNFGSVDGDSPASMRYTEARLSRIAIELLRDIDQETVDFAPNYDESEQEPTVLPSRFPNLLVNGSTGIAVGMATNMPPHNLGEVIDGVIAAIDNPEITTSELMEYIKGPDFPTSGYIMGMDGIRSAYETGRGSLLVRGKADIEENERGRTRIVISELPYQVNKARLTEKIAELVREKKITEISDLRDESDRKGMHLVVELKRDAIGQVVLNKLYKHTQLQTTFGVISLALVDGVPRVLSLQQIIGHYIDHQREIITRRTGYQLKKAEARAHILEGLLIALNHLDEVIKLIRGSETPDEAKTGLIETFALSAVQAQAILDMRLQRLTGLERGKIEAEYSELQETIKRLQAILADEKKVDALIKEELGEIRARHADPRRTKLRPSTEGFDIEDLIAEEDMVVAITHNNYIKRVPVTEFRQQHRGGRGVVGLNLKEGDFVEHLFISSTHNFVLFFSNFGKVYRMKVYELPLGSRQSRGQAAVNLLPLHAGETISAVICTRDFPDDSFLVMATKKGLVKKTAFSAYNTSRRDGIIAIRLREGDELIAVRTTAGDDDLLLVSSEGQAMLFNEKDVRSMGRVAAGVIGMRMGKEHDLLDMGVAYEKECLLVVTENGYGKRTLVSQYPRHRRGGKGVKTIQITKKKGRIAGARIVTIDHELMLMSSEGVIIRVSARDIPALNRATQGVKIMNLRKNESICAVARVVTSQDEEKAEQCSTVPKEGPSPSE